MKKGIVLEIDEGLLTLLTPEGEFLRTKRQDRSYTIGEEISFVPLENALQRKSFIHVLRMKPVWVAAAALIVTLGSLFPMYQGNHAYAYMSIDVNPSIELGINKKMQVVELTGFNEEGRQIISHLEAWKKQDVSKITESIISEIEKEGYLKDNKQLIISTVQTEKTENQFDKQLEANMKEIKAAVSEQQVELTVVSGTEKDLEKAHELGLTTGKYQTKNFHKDNGKEKSNKNRKSKGDSPQEDTTAIPPGQLKKQDNQSLNLDSSTVETAPQAGNGNTNHTGSENNSGNPIPPGQLKKLDGQNAKPSNGQFKKMEEQSTKNNYGQLKKQQNQNNNPGKTKKSTPENNKQK
jgi:Anti-sigma factor N-terminus